MTSGDGSRLSATAGEPNFPGAFPQSPNIPAISSHLSLQQAVHARRAEYTRSRKLRVKVGTWNVAALTGTWRDVGGWFVGGKGVSEALSGLDLNTKDELSEDSEGDLSDDGGIETVSEQEARRNKKESTIPKRDPGSVPGGTDIDIYALGLQEIVDINSATEALRPYSDPHPSKKWKRAVFKALPQGYQLIAQQQLIGLLLLIYAKSELANTISSVSTTSVGTGVMGYMGNKGAVTTRIILGETTRLLFVNCHLAAGTEKWNVERRNWDVSQIVSRTKFDPIQDGGGVVEEFGEEIGDEDFAFWFGDLNYRLDTVNGDDVRRLLMIHTRNEYERKGDSLGKIDNELMADDDVHSTHSKNLQHSGPKGVPHDSSITFSGGEGIDPSHDPSSLQTLISSLLSHDQLHQQMKSRKMFHDGWKEGPIKFMPTYKYDVGSFGMFDSSEKKRGPSWCDRILYRTREDKLEYEKMVKEEKAAKDKDAEMTSRGLDKSDDDVLFAYDPETDGIEESVQNSETRHDQDPPLDHEERLKLDYYTSHQRVLSSDHKPLDAVFTLTYDAVDPDLKAAVHQEVVRELDKAENEGRPTITVVIDHQDEIVDETINFGDIRYDCSKKRSMTVANTGRVPATLGFIDRNDGFVCPPWLDIRFDRPSNNVNMNPRALREYTLEPGDALNVDMTICITDMDQVRNLNEGKSKIDEVLVLRVHDGRDHFISIRGKWLQASFGRSLDKLIRIPEGGVRRLQHQKPDGSGHSNEEDMVKWSAPREVFRLTESIEELVERCVAEWGMKLGDDKPPWDTVGWPFDKDSWRCHGPGRLVAKHDVREALDTSEGFVFPAELETSHKVEVLAETLLSFLDHLDGGLITENLWQSLSAGMHERKKSGPPLSAEDERSWILDVLSVSPQHSVSFTFLTFMLAQVANEIAPLRSLPVSPATPQTPDALLSRGRRLGGVDPVIARRRQVDRKFADVLAPVIFQAGLPGKGKERGLAEEWRRGFVEVFLKGRGEEDGV